MSSTVRPLGRKSGFTLVELLIVVAIIGILSTIGVPTFRRMLQKSKKSEAKVALGGLYTAEQAFQSEYGGYGNNVAAIGVTTDGQNPIYQVGFPSAKCADITGGNGGANILPDATQNLGKNIKAAYPSYYSNANGGPVPNSMMTVPGGSVAGTLGACYVSITNNPGLAALPTSYNVFDAPAPATAGNSNVFVASAQGVIAPGADLTGATRKQVDVWTIDNTRTLANTQDGVQ